MRGTVAKRLRRQAFEKTVGLPITKYYYTKRNCTRFIPDTKGQYHMTKYGIKRILDPRIKIDKHKRYTKSSQQFEVELRLGNCTMRLYRQLKQQYKSREALA